MIKNRRKKLEYIFPRTCVAREVTFVNVRPHFIQKPHTRVYLKVSSFLNFIYEIFFKSDFLKKEFTI